MFRKEIDLNHDNRIDVVQLFDASGAKTSEHTDLDFDGRTDEIAHYKDGALMLREIDFNYDGRIDISKKYVKGTLTLIESDRTGDGKVDTWEYFENGSLARIGVDKDADGVVDTWEQKKVDGPAAPAEVQLLPKLHPVMGAKPVNQRRTKRLSLSQSPPRPQLNNPTPARLPRESPIGQQQ